MPGLLSQSPWSTREGFDIYEILKGNFNKVIPLFGNTEYKSIKFQELISGTKISVIFELARKSGEPISSTVRIEEIKKTLLTDFGLNLETILPKQTELPDM